MGPDTRRDFEEVRREAEKFGRSTYDVVRCFLDRWSEARGADCCTRVGRELELDPDEVKRIVSTALDWLANRIRLRTEARASGLVHALNHVSREIREGRQQSPPSQEEEVVETIRTLVRSMSRHVEMFRAVPAEPRDIPSSSEKDAASPATGASPPPPEAEPLLSDEDVAALVERAQGDDGEAYHDLFHLFHNRVRLIIELRLGGRLRRWVEVDDVLQETFLNAFLSIRRVEWRGVRAFRRWLGEIAERVILRLHRQMNAKKRPPNGKSIPLAVLESQGRLVDSMTPLKHVRRNERYELLRAALEKLSPDRREVILLSSLQGLPMREVAQRMGRTREACYMLLLRGLRELRRCLSSTEGSSRMWGSDGDPDPGGA